MTYMYLSAHFSVIRKEGSLAEFSAFLIYLTFSNISFEWFNKTDN